MKKNYIEYGVYFVWLIMVVFAVKSLDIALLITVVNYWFATISDHIQDIKNKLK